MRHAGPEHPRRHGGVRRGPHTVLPSALAAVTLALTTTLPASAADTGAAPPERIIDVVEVTWSGATTAKTSAAQVASVVSSDTIARWRKISNGQVEFQFGQTLPTITTRSQMPCDSSGSLEFMAAVSTAAYQRANIAETGHRFLIILTPSPTPDCIWEGRGTVGEPGSTTGRLLLKNTDDRTVIAHELGHNLGLGHSNYERCNDGRPYGPWTDCTAVEYGSATDLMSNNDRSSTLAAYHQWREGWIPDSDVAIGSRNTTVSLNAVDTSTGTRAIFIRDKTATYWVEYRKADPENGIDAGLVIYRSDPPPASSVDSPIASDRADPTSLSVTNDVWMISLGPYRYLASGGQGSPSLTSGKRFTTAYGGATLSASVNVDGTATVTITRVNSSAVPSTPQFTDQSTWRTPDALLLQPNLDDNGTDIVRFEARITSSGATRVEPVNRADPTNWAKTYLSPISAPANLQLSALPEGAYALELRAVDALGNTSNWSSKVDVKIDRGAPIVTNTFTQTLTIPGKPITLTWTGATDKGVGICQVQVFNDDGFALYKWVSDNAGRPTFRLDPQTTVQRNAVVYDCLGNGVTGELALQTAFTKASSLKRTGNWKTVGSALKCTTSCTAVLKTTATTTAIPVTGKAFSVSIDGRSAAASQLKAVGNGHVVKVSGTDFTLTGTQALTTAWTQRGLAAKKAIAPDSSLTDARQRAFSQLGFSQSDFDDTMIVLPLAEGTSTKQGTLDLCGTDYASEQLRTDRRQVFVSTRKSKYVFLSTETVRYRDAAATRQALQELDNHVAKCKADGYALSSAGTKQTHEFLQVSGGLGPIPDHRIYLVNIGDGAAATSLLAVYQFSSDTLNALYVVLAGANAIDTAAQSRWLDVAAILAQRLLAAPPIQ